MKICDLPNERSFSCEFFPPRTDAGVKNLIGRAQRLVALGAKFVSVTWGAGGTSADRSLELVTKLAAALGPTVPIVLHLTCTNMSTQLLDRTLAYIAHPDSGVDNILALRGDRPRNDYFTSSDFEWAEDLVKYIRQKYGNRFCIGVAAYPEGFADSPTLIPDVNHDLDFLADKIEAGAQFVMTQLFYDAAKYAAYVDKVRRHPRLGPKIADERLFPGLMPLISYRTFVRSAELSHASIPIQVLHGLKKLDTQDDEVVKKYGVQVLSKLVDELMDKYGVKRVHFFTLNLEKSLTEILVQTGLAEPKAAQRLLETAAPAAGAGTPGSAPRSPEANSSGWDEFVNGRYTDPASAAFGEIDGYGPIVHGSMGNKPNPAWGELESDSDISRMFVRHITNELPLFPFGDEALSAETALIQEQLIDLNLSGVWTLASQPAAHAQKSTDRILGWGPPNGVVYQQAYVEFLLSAEAWPQMKAKLDTIDNMAYYAASERGGVDTNCDKTARNVVTWGVWDGNRMDTTIVAYESFLAWRDETFGVIRGWQQLYVPEDPTYTLLGNVADGRVLVTVIYQNTQDDQKLWDTLLDI